MLEIVIPESEVWDESTNTFITINAQTLRLEHSLHSIAQWERKWCKPFLTDVEKSSEETIDYIKCMTLNEGVDPDVYNHLSKKNIDDIVEYIHAPMTATVFVNQKRGSNNGEQVTAELMYYWMIAMNVPHEYEYWHLNSLMTLIQVCSIKNQPGKKMGRKAIANQNASLNAARKKKFNTKG